MLRFAPACVVSLFCFAVQAHADVVGDTVTVANTFEDATLTGGVQGAFLLVEGTVEDPRVEFPTGFYGIDVSEGSYEMTLVDNSRATDLIFPDGRFDRYYVGFGTNRVTSVSLDPDAALNASATVELVEPGTVQVADLFGRGFDSFDLPNGGFVLSLAGGTDLTTIGSTAKVNFESAIVPEPSSMIMILLGFPFLLLRLRQRQ